MQRGRLLAAADPTLSSARRWSIVTLLFVASLINYLDRATLSVALPSLANELLLNPITKGLLLSAFFFPLSIPASSSIGGG